MCTHDTNRNQPSVRHYRVTAAQGKCREPAEQARSPEWRPPVSVHLREPTRAASQ